ncbi:MAG: radical SAM protein [Desulfobacterota bacterium]|nr:radical SAM protein [Thermodesulfobacteriota bacterium]
MKVIRKFDPWMSPLCTCPDKYSFCPYTGCGHGCIYCYVDYVPRFEEPRRKKDLMRMVEIDMKSINPFSIISVSNSSDPYQPMEEKFRDFRNFLEFAAHFPVKILITTKSDLVLRDLDILKRIGCAVMITITTLDEKLGKKLEPSAPDPSSRLDALETLTKNGIRCGVRIDPIIPYLNENEIETIVKEVKRRGASHITSSTYKARKRSFAKLTEAFPKLRDRFVRDYLENGKRMRNSLYLDEKRRRSIMERVKIACDTYGISFSTCREGFFDLKSSASCDGSHLLTT